MEAWKFLRHRQLLAPGTSLHETAMPNYTWGDLIKLLEDYSNSNRLEKLGYASPSSQGVQNGGSWEDIIKVNEKQDFLDVILGEIDLVDENGADVTIESIKALIEQKNLQNNR